MCKVPVCVPLLHPVVSPLFRPPARQRDQHLLARHAAPRCPVSEGQLQLFACSASLSCFFFDAAPRDTQCSQSCANSVFKTHILAGVSGAFGQSREDIQFREFLPPLFRFLFSSHKVSLMSDSRGPQACGLVRQCWSMWAGAGSAPASAPLCALEGSDACGHIPEG